jgi:glycosyltransferase involved in cell wall biosynthesis
VPLHVPPPEGLDARLVIVLSVRDVDAIARCLSALLPTLPTDVPLLAGGSPSGARALQDLCVTRDVTWFDAEGAELWNKAAELAPLADLVLIDDATEVAARWLDDLRTVAASEPDAATVTTLSNSAGFLSAPRRNLPWPLLPPALNPAEAAGRVREGALRLHPRTPTALPHCAYVARAARQLVGLFDATLEPREALADFCARCTAAGLPHVVADELFVAHRGPPAEHEPGTWNGEAVTRHPGLGVAIDEAATDRHSALSRALLAASVVLEPVQVTLDARSLGPGVTGTIVHVVEVLGALAERKDVRVRALLPVRVGPEGRHALDRMPRVERLSSDALDGPIARTHVVHRPWQVESTQDMAVLDALGERIVLTNQDLIGYRTPSVYPSAEAWRDYRRATRDALGLAAMVLFFSKAAAADAVADDLIPPYRARVIPLGADNRHLNPEPAAEPPPSLAGVHQRFLLILGNRFRHKNVRFALELLGTLRVEHSWDGDLVIAGAEVLHGSGSGDDAAWLLRHPEHAPHVHTIGAVSEGEKTWLMHEAAAVVYPSTYEGFGLIPFEAVAAGTPCLLAHVSALRDSVPPELALLTPWDARASAARAIRVLRDDAVRAELVDGLRRVATSLTWRATGEGLVAAYRDAVRLPAPLTARLTHDLARTESDYWSVRDGISDELWSLVRPDGSELDRALGARLSALLRRPNGRQRLLRSLPDRQSLLARVARGLRRVAGP